MLFEKEDRIRVTNALRVDRALAQAASHYHSRLSLMRL